MTGGVELLSTVEEEDTANTTLPSMHAQSVGTTGGGCGQIPENVPFDFDSIRSSAGRNVSGSAAGAGVTAPWFGAPLDMDGQSR